MSYGTASDELVAEDYRKALEDLTMNSRYEISNLTVIAKENTEHALAIAEAVKSHIKQTAPQKKLPAFYVLDSVVKNVGTPYTLFFGRQLYSTFMEAYALVDNSVRRKMDEMLKTWKEPVPGSMDTRPVFPPDVTRPIENALIKARTSAVQAQQEQMRNNQQQYLGRGRPVASPAPYQQTPTPPAGYRQQPPPAQYQGYPPQQYQSPPINPQQYQNQPSVQYQPPPTQQYQTPPPNPQYPMPPSGQQYQGQPSGYPQHGLPPRPPTQQYPQPYSSPAPPTWQQPAPPANQGLTETVSALNRDIEKLITTAKAEWALNEYDTAARTRLKALLDLQTILQNQTLPPDQIALIQKQVAQLSASAQPLRLPSTPAPLPVASVAPPQQPTLSSILGPGALQALLARQNANPQATPPIQPSMPIRSPQTAYQAPYQPPPASTATPVPDPSDLLARLRASGLLGKLPPPPPPPLAGPQPGKLLGFPPPPPFLGTPPTSSRPALASIPNDVVLKPASLKIPRPHLIAGLYEHLGTPCTQCGRRFQIDEEGKKKKAAHMDWHFRVRQRMEEAETKGQHRSWYVDELDWIRSREIEGDAIAPEAPTNGSTAAATKDPKMQYLPVPDDPAMANSVCPICQEKFEMKWLDEAQEFVWMDAKKIGERIYHASCHEEATKDKIRRLTPEPVGVLGKRKAEDEGMTFRAKIKTEQVA